MRQQTLAREDTATAFALRWLVRCLLLVALVAAFAG